jgi:hypothetical protein
MWYNMRMSCDPEHRAAWRCERINGKGSPSCQAINSIYQDCIKKWPCPNWGVCAPVDSPPCGVEAGMRCDTRLHNYDDEWGQYYGLQWSSPELHRFLTIKVKDGSGKLIAAFSSNPGSDDAYMGGSSNFGVGAQPQGHIQLAPSKSALFGSFACIRLPAGQPLELQAIWMNDFCHTCSSSYWAQPHTPCRTAAIAMSFAAGRHYEWTEKGIVQMAGCSGPPPAIAQRLPAASCSTAQ